jgi:catechol 2,3-dioxygenase-like lactoylglutathione lyase family enzyme
VQLRRLTGVRSRPIVAPLDPPPARVYETVLYASDVGAAAAFYRDAIGLTLVEEPSDLMAVFRLADGGHLLLFDPAQAAEPGRFVPSHGTTGEGHVAFSVPASRLEDLMRQLGDLGLEIERDITWPLGGRSIYLRDPAGNSVELIGGDAWPAP